MIERRAALQARLVASLRRLSWAHELLPPRATLPLRLKLQRLLGVLEPEFALLPILARADRGSVDAGANVGVYTYALSKLSAAVYSFEPLEHLARFIERARLPNVRVANLALSDHIGSGTIRVPIIDGRPRSTRAAIDSQVVDFIEHSISVSTLDAQRLADIGFIKIDVEGHELELLAGAAATIRTSRPNILIELESNRLRGATIRRAFDLLEGWDYGGQFYLGGKLHPLSHFDVTRHQSEPEGPGRDGYVNNFIFLPAGGTLQLPRQL